MTSPGADLPFDDGPTRAQLIGTWSYPRLEEPSRIDYLHFHESGIAFQFIQLADQPNKPLRVRMKYSIESLSHLRIRKMKGDQTGWTIEFRLEGDVLRLINPNGTYVCTRLAPADLPEWFLDAMANYL